MESQKLSQTQYTIVYLISFISNFSHIKRWDDKFLVNNAAPINVKKVISKNKNIILWKLLLMVWRLDTDPEPDLEPEP